MAEGENKGERLDRELMELLQGLRVVMPGVQVLLAFLLTAPFQQRFAQLPGVELEEAGLVLADLADVDLVEAGVEVLPEALQMPLRVGPAGDRLGHLVLGDQ